MNVANGFRTILCVDDDYSLLNSLQRNLGRSYRVVTAGNANEAMTILNGGSSIDLILSDHLMPGIKGVDMLRQVKIQHPNIPTILMSGHADMPLALDAVNKARVTKILQKPCGTEELRSHIDEIFAFGTGGEVSAFPPNQPTHRFYPDHDNHPYFMVYQPKAYANTGAIHS
jgi:DNA-binding NtrC family response regulator